MKKLNGFLGLISLLLLGLFSADSASADLGSAELPLRPKKDYLETVHKALCSSLHQDCVVTFRAGKMSVDGSSGISRAQLVGFRTEFDRQETYFYVDYIGSSGDKRSALFLFHNRKAASYFGQSLSRWYNADPNAYPVTY